MLNGKDHDHDHVITCEVSLLTNKKKHSTLQMVVGFLSPGKGRDILDPNKLIFILLNENIKSI